MRLFFVNGCQQINLNIRVTHALQKADQEPINTTKTLSLRFQRSRSITHEDSMGSDNFTSPLFADNLHTFHLESAGITTHDIRVAAKRSTMRDYDSGGFNRLERASSQHEIAKLKDIDSTELTLHPLGKNQMQLQAKSASLPHPRTK